MLMTPAMVKTMMITLAVTAAPKIGKTIRIILEIMKSPAFARTTEKVVCFCFYAAVGTEWSTE